MRDVVMTGLIGATAFAAVMAACAWLGDRAPGAWAWTREAARVVVCGLPATLAVLAASLAYFPDRPGRAAAAIIVGGALSALLLWITRAPCRG